MADDLNRLVQARREAGGVALPVNVDKLGIYFTLIKGAVVFIVLGAMWIARLTFMVSANTEFKEQQIKVNEKYDAYINSNNLVSQANQSSVESIRNRVTNIDKTLSDIIPEVAELWFMRIHNINNSTLPPTPPLKNP